MGFFGLERLSKGPRSILTQRDNLVSRVCPPHSDIACLRGLSRFATTLLVIPSSSIAMHDCFGCGFGVVVGLALDPCLGAAAC